MTPAVPLSVLDLAPVVSGSTPAQALANSLDLVRRAERLGYTRYWVAEHHNMTGIASSAPAVLIAHLASVTERLRIGSGGVMLPNHAPLVVAEQFGMLEALHPGRIDLGIGRAPGTDQVTASALRRGPAQLSAEEFPRHLGELLAFFNGTFPEGHPYREITAVPGLGYQPAIWLLGSSDYSAQLAGMLGLPFSFAHHFSAANTIPALAIYRHSFEPSATLAEPYALIAVGVIVGEDDAHADWLAGPARLSFVRRRTGRPAPLPTPDEAAEHRFTPLELELLRSWAPSSIVGGPDTVRSQLDALVDRTGASEVMVTTSVHAHHDRIRSYELLAEAYGLGGATEAA
ncbi:MAG TPA: LLM class flavin-dependent oxidoreductase [Acidimicrobiales bacterium]|nr:LLM class flavin-dependent oxidoreductase [Acidimicrobiales bacterium]